jgi:hypothetical protein
MSLRAPLAVVVEIRADDRRWFRLSRNVGDDGVTLQRPLPLDPGRPVEMRLLLPLAAGPTGAGGDAAAPAPPTDEATLLARAEVVAEDGDDPHGQGGGRGLLFLEPSRDRRAAIARYVKERLALHLS